MWVIVSKKISLYCLCCCCLIAKHVLLFCIPLDCSPPGSSVHEISQTRILKWVAISSRGIFPTQRSSLSLLHWQVDSLPLKHQGGPFVLSYPTVLSVPQVTEAFFFLFLLLFAVVCNLSVLQTVLFLLS